ncbi:MAG: hypothetical protein HQK97_07625 [Nitrospirae bacterium]|nr:hypothetical protein [Nitrospirota bacterium]
MKWLLAHKGQSIANFKIIEGVKYYLYAQAADEVAGTPRIVVLYTCDDNAIYIEGIDAHL